MAAGCAAPTDPAASPPPFVSPPTQPAPTSTTPTPDAAETPAESPAGPVPAVPDACELLLPVELISETLDEAWHDSGEPVDAASHLPGPVARSAAANAAEMLSCRWVPDAATEGFLLGFAVQVDAVTKGDLVAALAESDAYSAVDLTGAEDAFVTSELRGDLRHTLIYAFVDDVWVALHAPLYSDVLSAFAETAVANAGAG